MFDARCFNIPKEEVTNIVKDNNAEVTKETKTEVKDAEKVVENLGGDC